VLLGILVHGQKHNLYFQVMPQFGSIRQEEFYVKSGIVAFDTLNEVVTQRKLGYLYAQNYRPFGSLYFGIESRNRFFYQFSVGAQLGETEYLYNVNWINEAGVLSEEVFFGDYNNDSDSIGLKSGLALNPNVELGLGFNFNDKDKVLVKTSLWSYAISYQRDWDRFSLGFSTGKFYDLITNKIKIGPWMLEGSDAYNEQSPAENPLIWSAYLSLNLSAMKSSGGQSKPSGTPEEF
jgi:hypothetical protein